MDKFKKSLSLRKKKKDKTPEDDPNNKPMSWQEDEKKVREGSCSFQVKYLGFIEVFDSRGMQVCEEAIKALKRPKKKVIRAILYVSGDTIRVSDEISKGLIVDQTIEKVSFCSPDRNHKRGFAYICRDGTTRRWMCHSFLAIKETGERLSHAVGCAFAICLEKKQKRESDVIQPAASESGIRKNSTFRQTSLTERQQDPQSAIIAYFPTSNSPHPPAINVSTPNRSRAAVIPRPHASASFFSDRQTSLRMFPKLQESSPFKRELSLRLSEQPRSSPIIHKTGTPIDEERNECSSDKDSSGHISAFSNFTKDMYISDTSVSNSPAHTMSSSFQSDSPNNFHSNPFLLNGSINYGALSTFTSQEGINNVEQKNVSTGNGELHSVENIVKGSFQKLQVTESNLSHSFTNSTNGSSSRTNFDNTHNIWQNKFPFDSITTPYETVSTNPWSGPCPVTNDQNLFKTSHPNTASPSMEYTVTPLLGHSDPFDVSWIGTRSAVEDRTTPSSLSTNPFLT